jgi:sulfur-oxidizing protein SoxB
MTPHWEMTLGAERVKQIVDNDFKGRVSFLAQNIKTNDFGDPVFEPYVIRDMNGVPVAIIGQAFPTRRSPTRATSCRTGPSASRKKTCSR